MDIVTISVSEFLLQLDSLLRGSNLFHIFVRPPSTHYERQRYSNDEERNGLFISKYITCTYILGHRMCSMFQFCLGQKERRRRKKDEASAVVKQLLSLPLSLCTDTFHDIISLDQQNGQSWVTHCTLQPIIASCFHQKENNRTHAQTRTCLHLYTKKERKPGLETRLILCHARHWRQAVRGRLTLFFFFKYHHGLLIALGDQRFREKGSVRIAALRAKSALQTHS